MFCYESDVSHATDISHANGDVKQRGMHPLTNKYDGY